MNIPSYLQLPLTERQKHINLSSPCDFSGGKGGSRKRRMRKNLCLLLLIDYESNIQQFGACLCHKCPNNTRSGAHYCVNPEHIYLGTLSENRRDTHRDNPGLAKKITEKSQPKAVKAALNPEAKRKRKETLRNIQHQKGEKNSQFGTIWVTNGEANLKISKDSPIPQGYRRGRTL